MSGLDISLLGIGALAGSTLAGVTGFGGAAILLPILIYLFGVKTAIPILTVAQLIGNGSRVYFHRHDLNRGVAAYFAVGAIPAALIGGYFFASAPAPLLLRGIGLFLLITVAWRRFGSK